MIICGLDYGEKYIGVAFSDESETIAGAHGVVVRDGRGNWLQELKKLFEERRVLCLVVGRPITMSGQEGYATDRVAEFIDQIKKVSPLQVELHDERMTTLEAERYLRETPVSGTKRRSKVNQLAAQILLQSYLDQRKNKK